jgi:hypothetical protein
MLGQLSNQDDSRRRPVKEVACVAPRNRFVFGLQPVSAGGPHEAKERSMNRRIK